MDDEQFEKRLHDWLARTAEGRSFFTPVVRDKDNVIDRAATLAQPCYYGMPE